jgi:hypothetical protein
MLLLFYFIFSKKSRELIKEFVQIQTRKGSCMYQLDKEYTTTQLKPKKKKKKKKTKA